MLINLLRKASIAASLVLTVACCYNRPAQAGVINTIAAAGGSGTFTSAPVISTIAPDQNDGNFFATENGGTVTMTQNRTGLGAFDSTVTAADTDQSAFPASVIPGSTTEYQFTVNSTNTSGQAFYTYTFQIVGAPPGTTFDIPNGTPTPTGTGYTVSSHTPGTIVYSGLQNPGTPTTFTFSVDVPNGFGPSGTFILRQIAAVPEPSTYAMFTIGLIGILLFARRKKRIARSWASQPELV